MQAERLAEGRAPSSPFGISDRAEPKSRTAIDRSRYDVDVRHLGCLLGAAGCLLRSFQSHSSASELCRRSRAPIELMIR